MVNRRLEEAWSAALSNTRFWTFNPVHRKTLALAVQSCVRLEADSALLVRTLAHTTAVCVEEAVIATRLGTLARVINPIHSNHLSRAASALNPSSRRLEADGALLGGALGQAATMSKEEAVATTWLSALARIVDPIHSNHLSLIH